MMNNGSILFDESKQITRAVGAVNGAVQTFHEMGILNLWLKLIALDPGILLEKAILI